VVCHAEEQFAPKSRYDTSESTMRAYFITQLRNLFASRMPLSEDFSSAFSRFIGQVEQFIGLLIQLRDLPDSTEWADERADAIFQLMDFVQRQGRTPLYVRFAGQLVDIHLEAADEVTAAFAIHLQALAYDWDEGKDSGKIVPAMPAHAAVASPSKEQYRLPAQTPWARRESLYLLAIDHFSALQLLSTIWRRATRSS
jgi:dedicator of cytokinesis protein 3